MDCDSRRSGHAPDGAGSKSNVLRPYGPEKSGATPADCAGAAHNSRAQPALDMPNADGFMSPVQDPRGV